MTCLTPLAIDNAMRLLAPLLLTVLLSAKAEFDHAFVLEPLTVAEAHHGEKMRLSRFLVARPGIEETPTRLVGRCVDGDDVREQLPLQLAVVELRLDSLSFGFEELGPSDGGVPGKQASDSLQTRLAQAAEASRWLGKRGCKPWEGERPWILLAADARVPMDAVNTAMEHVHAAGFRDIAVLVDDGSPGPEYPPESPPKNPTELLLVEREGDWSTLTVAGERRTGSLDDVQVWLRTGELAADRVTVVMNPDSDVQALVHAHDALVGAGVLFVVPAQAEGAALSVVQPARELTRAPVGWSIDAEGVVPVHLIRLPERGVRVPPPRVGPELEVKLEGVGPLSALVVEASLTKGFDDALACHPRGEAGELTARFTVEASGRASDIDLPKSALGACLRPLIQNAEFRSAESATLVTAQFVYTP
jgi:hypothetical protein